MRLKWISVTLCIALIFGVAYAHPGSLDENGGHWNHSTGTYHYHGGANQGSNPTGNYTGQYSTSSGVRGNSHGSGGGSSILGLLALATISIVIVIGCVASHKARVEEMEHERLAKELAHNRKQYLLRNDLRTLSGMPDDVYMDSSFMPVKKDLKAGDIYGENFDVYIAWSHQSKTYHKRECRFACKYAHALADDKTQSIRGRSPCKYCHPGPLPDYTWYDKYMKLLEECRKLGIEPKREPENN